MVRCGISQTSYVFDAMQKADKQQQQHLSQQVHTSPRTHWGSVVAFIHYGAPISSAE